MMMLVIFYIYVSVLERKIFASNLHLLLMNIRGWSIFSCHKLHCFELYQEYGDIVAFDTTYKVNSYNMPFGIFIGVDNHGRPILFGCALLQNETISTFQWLMKVSYYTSLLLLNFVVLLSFF